MEESTLLDITKEEQIYQKNNISTKELLSNLLKKMLEHKLSKLEKRNIEESNSLKGISKISQNLIGSLNYYNYKVKKELCKIRQKNDENITKKKYLENNKSLLKEDKNIDNNIESLIESKDNILENNINNISHINKTQRISKSIEAKKAKKLILTPETNPKEKKVKKEKTDVFSRLASKSIGNFKKLKLTMTEPINHHTIHSKSKNLKMNLSKKKMVNIQNKKNDVNNNKDDTPSRPEKKTEKDNILKLTSTPKVKQKLKKFTQMNLDNSNTLSSSNNTLRLKKINSKGKLPITVRKKSKEKKEEKKENEENEINDISVENKIREIKIENVIFSEIDKKGSINVFNDEELLKNMNKDELLTPEINTEINNDNIDQTLKDISLKESINTNIDIDLTKKENTEITGSINSFNQNKETNNIKLISSNNNPEEKKEAKVKKSRKDNDLDNIILPRNINNFLDNEKEINFSLINNPNDEDNINDKDLNKTIDLNISGLSEHLSLEVKFESYLDEITRYLDTSDICKLLLVNKECYTSIMNILISKTEITIDILEEEISKLKETNKDINFDLAKISPFTFNSNSSRAILLLNNSSGFNLNNLDSKMSREIFIIFGIYFISVGKKKEYLNLINEEQKINYISNYFKKEISLGNLIEKEIKGKIFDDDTIASLYKYSFRYKKIISPNRFQRINKDFAIFVFVVKNILEHIGVLEQNFKAEKEFILYNARLKNNKEMLEILNGYFDKIG